MGFVQHERFGRGRPTRWYRIENVATRENEPYAHKSLHANALAAPLRSATLAAELLESACASGGDEALRLGVVRTLARDLKEELETLAALADQETSTMRFEGVEGALRSADVANLAACTVPDLLETQAAKAAAAAHLAAGIARALSILVEAEDVHEDHAQNALKDARSAAWRARLAARQVDELLG